MCHYSGFRWHPKTVILYSITVESGQEGSYWIFFSPLKIVQGWYFNIFNQTAVVYLYYNCHQDPYLPSVQREADASSFFIRSILWGCHLHCKRRLGCVCRDLTWRLEGRETAQSKVVIGVVTRGPSDTDSWLTKPLESTTWNSCLGKWKAALWKDLFFFHPTQTNWWVTTDSHTMTYCCHGIDCVHAMSGTHCGEDISVIFLEKKNKSCEWVMQWQKSCWFSFSDLIEQIPKRFIDKRRLHLLQRHLPLIYTPIRESLCVVTTACHHPITEQAGSFFECDTVCHQIVVHATFGNCKCYLTWSVWIP